MCLLLRNGSMPRLVVSTSGNSGMGHREYVRQVIQAIFAASYHGVLALSINCVLGSYVLHLLRQGGHLIVPDNIGTL